MKVATQTIHEYVNRAPLQYMDQVRVVIMLSNGKVFELSENKQHLGMLEVMVEQQIMTVAETSNVLYLIHEDSLIV